MRRKCPWPLTTPRTCKPASSRTPSAFLPVDHRGTFSIPIRRCWGTLCRPLAYTRPSFCSSSNCPLSPLYCKGERGHDVHMQATTESQTFPPGCSDVYSEGFLKGSYWQIFVAMVQSVTLHGKHSLHLLLLICKPETEIIYTRWFYGFLVYITTTKNWKTKKSFSWSHFLSAAIPFLGSPLQQNLWMSCL